MFKIVEQYPPFAIKKDGAVKSLHTGNIITTHTSNKNGYVYAVASVNGKSVAVRVHRLIAIAFIPNPENKPCVNHKNSIRNDNRIENLEWVTHSENMKHALEFGYAETRKGEDSNLCVYSEDDIRDACLLLSDGCRIIDIQKITGLSRSVINHLKAGNSWVHVSSEYFKPEDIPGKSKMLSVDKVQQICKLIMAGDSIKNISTILNVNYGTVRDIKSRKTYKTLSEPFMW